MEKTTIPNQIRSNRKVLTTQEVKKTVGKMIINKKSKSTPKNYISLSKKVLESPSSINNDNINGKTNKKKNFNLSEINLNELVPLEYLEFPPPGSGKKPNYLSKSLFCKGRIIPNNNYRKKNTSPIYQYYDQSFETVKNNIEGKNSFSYFMNQMNEEENNFNDNMDKIEEDTHEILGFQDDSSADEDEGNSQKLSSFVQKIIKNNEEQEENNKNNLLYNFNYNFCKNNDLDDGLKRNNNNNVLRQPEYEKMNVNISINNNSTNNYHYQYKENINNNFKVRKPYMPKKSSDYLNFGNFSVNNNKTPNKIINNIENNTLNNNEILNNIYYKQQQNNYSQQFYNNQSQFNFLYNQNNNNQFNNTFIRYGFKNPYKSYSSNDLIRSLNSQRFNNNQYNYMKKRFNYNYNSLPDDELAKHAHLIAKIQNGCRFLEKKIEDNPELVDSLFFNNILSYVEELATDQFGNYFIKKMFHYLSENKLLQFIAIIFPAIQIVSTDLYGTRVLQDLIDFLKTDKLLSAFVKIIVPYISIFVNDSNAVHIIYKLINIENNIIENIHEALCSQILDIATNRKGCSFLKKYLEIMNENKIKNIIKAIEDNLVSIITDQYGNYCIQSIIVFQNQNIKLNIIDQIAKNICFYSNQKFSSNVVEKCFEDTLTKDIVMKKILIEENFHTILLDNFGNYVVQKAISCSNEETQEKFFKMLVPLIPQLQKLNFGQKLFSKLLIQYPKFSLYMLNMTP